MNAKKLILVTALFATTTTAAVASGLTTASATSSYPTNPNTLPTTIQRVSNGAAESKAPAIDGSGRYVVFASTAANLTPDDTNNVMDVFVRDLLNRTTTRVSVGPSGAQGNALSWWPSISADGRYVAFQSDATNFAANDTNRSTDIFVRDLVAQTTTRVSVTGSGAQANTVSILPEISADGHAVAFVSYATNLVTNDTNGAGDIFVRDLVNQTTVRASVATSGAQSTSPSLVPGISATGRYVTFRSAGSNLVPNDTNGVDDMFVRDLVNQTTTRVSVGAAGEQANDGSWGAAASADGRYVAFESNATNLVPNDTNGGMDIFVRDLVAQTTTRVSLGAAGEQANGASDFGFAMSSDARYLAFPSRATNIVPGDTNNLLDVFVRDLVNQTSVRVSVPATGGQANGNSTTVVMSPDGHHVAFSSTATNLVPDDTNGLMDVFWAPVS